MTQNGLTFRFAAFSFLGLAVRGRVLFPPKGGEGMVSRQWYTGGAVGGSLRKRSSVPPRTVSGRTFARLGVSAGQRRGTCSRMSLTRDRQLSWAPYDHATASATHSRGSS